MSRSEGVLILDPTVKGPETGSARPAPRHGSLDGLTIGLLANGKTNAMAILEGVLENLRKTHRIADVLRATKPNASMPVPDVELERMAERCHAVISAIGD